MSKTFRAILLISAATVLILHSFNNSYGQDIEVRIKISADSPATAEIEGKYLSRKPRKNPRNLSFLNEYGTTTRLAERISNVELLDAGGYPIANKRFNAGEYVAEADIASWKYRVDLTPPKQQAAAAHVSWLKGEIGLLMLDDLLPQTFGEKVGARVTVVPPSGSLSGWDILTSSPINIVGRSEILSYEGNYFVDDIERASFFVGRNWRQKGDGLHQVGLNLAIAGDWQFTDDEAAKMAKEIFDGYAKTLGSTSEQKTQIVSIMKFPGDVSIGNWEGDTRGSSITIASSDMPFKSQSLQRLHEQLRHEMFHLWFPNDVNLSGTYDWFYEGFALYQATKMGVAMNQIRFEDYLGTMSRAYDIDKSQASKLSLIDASKNRWNGSNTQVYARGMLVAFLCDVALLEASKGKVSTDNLVREIYQKYHAAAQREDGNAAILAIIATHAELRPIADRYITGAAAVEWRDLLTAAGLETTTAGTLSVVPKPTGRQKDLLDKLGYNSWRKLTSK